MSLPRSSHRPMTALEWVMLLALATVWGGSFFFNEIAVRELPVFTVVVSRVALAAMILLMIMRLRREQLPHDRWVWVAFFGMGLLNNAIPFSLIVWGQQHIASGVASILQPFENQVRVHRIAPRNLCNRNARRQRLRANRALLVIRLDPLLQTLLPRHRRPQDVHYRWWTLSPTPSRRQGSQTGRIRERTRRLLIFMLLRSILQSGCLSIARHSWQMASSILVRDCRLEWVTRPT